MHKFYTILIILLYHYSFSQDGIIFVNNADSVQPITIDTLLNANSEDDMNISNVPPTSNLSTKNNLLDRMNAKGLKISGSLGAMLGYYYTSSATKRMKPFTYQLTGDVTFNYKNVLELPFSFVFSEQDRKFNQPFNQIGVSPKYKWLTAHAGFRNINWSEHSMAGHNMLMVGAEVNPSYFRAGLLFGRLNKVTLADSAKIDSLHLQTFIPTYKRLGAAVKLGAGTENNYVDLIYFRAWDKSKDSFLYVNPDGIQMFLPKSENAVFNIVTYNKIRKYITIKADYALSTTNVDKSLMKDKNIVNADYPKIARILMKPNASAIGGHAATTDFEFSKDGLNTNVGFHLITKNFNTYGAYYLQTNFYDVYVKQVVPLQDKKANITIQTKFTDDNLNKEKPYATKRVITQFAYDYNAAKFGISTQYINAYSKQKAITDSLKNSSFNDLLLNQMNHTFTLAPRYLIVKKDKSHLIMLNEVMNFLTDLNKNTKSNSAYFNNVINLTYAFNLPVKYFSMSSSIFSTYLKTSTSKIASYGASFSSNVSVAKNKVNISDAIAYTYNKIAQVLNVDLMISYAPETHHKIYLSNNLIWNHTTNNTAQRFTEIRGNVGYLFTF